MRQRTYDFVKHLVQEVVIISITEFDNIRSAHPKSVSSAASDELSDTTIIIMYYMYY